jgi:hypothetical protein
MHNEELQDPCPYETLAGWSKKNEMG